MVSTNSWADCSGDHEIHKNRVPHIGGFVEVDTKHVYSRELRSVRWCFSLSSNSSEKELARRVPT